MAMPHSHRPSPPAFNVPGVILTLAAIVAAVHAVRTYLLTPDGDFWAILTFAFIPARYGVDLSQYRLPPGFAFPGGAGADIWTYLSYGFLHGDWIHVIVNLLWMVAFGSAVARRFGTLRFLMLSAAATVGGAMMHQAFHFGEFVPMVGASAGVSGMMGAAVRFAFTGPRPLIGATSAPGYHAPASGLLEALSDRRVMAFVAVWFGLNLLFGTGAVAVPGASGSIAWEAHVGGFLVGLLAFKLFDPPPKRPPGMDIWT